VDLTSSLVEWLPTYGPWLVFALVVLETSFFTGFVVPASVATSAATVLALEGRMDLTLVIVAAGAGAFIGDSVGFWAGRLMEQRLEVGTGAFSRQFMKHHQRVGGLLERHPVYSVTVARLLSFVRTLMPMTAGMSGMSYVHYLTYQIPGLIGWLGIYVSVGVLAGESWDIAIRSIGAGGALMFVVLGGALRRLLKRRPGPGEGGANQEAPC
jgi:membrane protein DedA with SNARE-associated domain